MKNIIPRINKRPENKKENNDDNIQIINDEKYIVIRAKKSYLKTIDNFQLSKLLLLSLSPIFTNENKEVKFEESIKSNHITNNPFPHIAFFIESPGHYTGGRYATYHQAVLLSQYVDVTVVTNAKPPFYNDFKDYYSKRFRLIVNQTYLIENTINIFDVIVAVPNVSGSYAKEYAKKFNLPLYSYIFETPNWVSKFRDGADGTEEYWAGYKQVLLASDKIITISNESKRYLLEWIDYDKDKVEVIYPCINEIVANDVKKHYIAIQHRNSKIHLVFSSRMVDFKSPLAIIKKLHKKKPGMFTFHIIGKSWEIGSKEIDKQIGLGIDIIKHGIITDKEKFKLMAEMDVLIHSSMFEGFCIPVLEALYFSNKRCIVYDLPILREIYNNSIIYAKLGDVDDFVNKILLAINDKITSDEPKNLPTMKQTTNRLLEVFNISKITAGVIVYNGEDYLKYAIKSIYHLLHQIIIVDGRVVGYDDDNDDFKSNDGTIDTIVKLKEIDYLHKIEFVEAKKLWNDKIEKQNEIAKRVTGEYYLKLDHDEIIKSDTLIDAIKVMKENNVDILKMPFYHFWLSFNNIAVDAGGKWGTLHPRLFRFRKGFHHDKSFNYFVDAKGVKVAEPIYKEMEYKGDRIYHTGYLRKLNVLQEKIRYYKNRGIEKYVVDTVTGWKDGKSPTQPTQHVDSHSIPFEGVLPEILEQHPYRFIKDMREVK